MLVIVQHARRKMHPIGNFTPSQNFSAHEIMPMSNTSQDILSIFIKQWNYDSIFKVKTLWNMKQSSVNKKKIPKNSYMCFNTLILSSNFICILLILFYQQKDEVIHSNLLMLYKEYKDHFRYQISSYNKKFVNGNYS